MPFGRVSREGDMKTIIVDDDPGYVLRLEKEFRDIREVEVVGSFRNPRQALEYAEENTVEFALLDIRMPEMDGLELGRRLKEIYPGMVLIYVTGYSDHVVDVLRMKADYCIMKPYDRCDIEDATQRACLLSRRQRKTIAVRMFGRFDLFCGGMAVYFKNAKSKELLALCFDHCGGSVAMEEAIDKLWPERVYDEKVKKLYRKAVMNLQETLRPRGIRNLFRTGRGSCCILKEEVDCDYYAYLEDPLKNDVLFRGEYLFDYSWGEETLASLLNGTLPIHWKR